jgi:peptidoglycan/LPS O-acetylase OafA/YrhL
MIAALKNRLRRITSDGSYIAEVEGLRFVAISSVVLLHLHSQVFRTRGWEIAATGTFAELGRGVQLFFVISGFILSVPFASAYRKERPPISLKRYFLRRLTRLETPYLLNVLIVYWLLQMFGYGASGKSWPHLLATMAYVHVPIYGSWSTISAVTWSLEVEIQFYIVVPLLTIVFAIRSTLMRRVLLAAAIAATCALRLAFVDSDRFMLSLPGNVTFFLTGMLLADLYLWHWNRKPAQHWSWDLAGVAAVPAFFLLGAGAWELLLPLAALVTCVAAFRSVALRWALTRDWITIVGGMCYSIYLFHNQAIAAGFTLTRQWGLALGPQLYLMLQVFALLPCVLLGSAIYFAYVERPCMVRDWPQKLWARVTGSDRDRLPEPERANAQKA